MGDKKRIYLAKSLIYNASEEPYFIFHSSTLIRFNNANETTLHANQINFITGQQQISLQNLDFKVKYNPSARQLISNATAKSLTIIEQQNNLITLNNLALHNELQQKNSLWYGQRSLKADKLIYYLSPH
ncbi:DUF945 family protein [Coxiella-like endosymbiont]|uniref:DUF945 family protein n=1 Tax=Coxiella-like endosymbiont TaxID=1592897 RepID=UPI00272D9336|nr:DUF945 family protein [Coxiella-like endosymbiont]